MRIILMQIVLRMSNNNLQKKPTEIIIFWIMFMLGVNNIFGVD